MGMLEQMRSLLKPGGAIFITFCPPWYAPYGSHSRFFCKVPWVHLLFSERTVVKVRSRYRSDGVRTYAEWGLGKMSVAKFERLLAESGLLVERLNYVPVKKLPIVKHLPIIRELFINRVECLLRLSRTL
jgi:hypothetical protein